jgi:hypothetical protein
VPLFYLHLCDGEGYHRDDEGMEVADLAEARASAIEGLRDTLAGEIQRGLINIGAFIDIENEKRQRVDTVHFADAVRISNTTLVA